MNLIDSTVGNQKHRDSLKRSVQNQLLPHALIFSGPSGVGKKRTALGLTQILCCEKNGCGVCGVCNRIAQEQSENLFVLNPDGSSIKIDQIHSLQSFLNLQNISRAKVIVINEAHLLNPQASNALLKTLEEPHSNTYLILVTANENALLPTIRSRSQILRFFPLSQAEIQSVHPVPDWLATACQGRFDLLHDLQSAEKREWREQAVLFFQRFVDKQEKNVFIELKNFTKEKTEFVFSLKIWQQLVRDACAVKAAQTKNTIHQDQLDFLQKFSQKSWGQLLYLAQSLIKIETDILANLDRSLLIENLWLDWQKL